MRAESADVLSGRRDQSLVRTGLHARCGVRIMRHVKSRTPISCFSIENCPSNHVAARAAGSTCRSATDAVAALCAPRARVVVAAGRRCGFIWLALILAHVHHGRSAAGRSRGIGAPIANRGGVGRRVACGSPALSLRRVRVVVGQSAASCSSSPAIAASRGPRARDPIIRCRSRIAGLRPRPARERRARGAALRTSSPCVAA